jgi:nitrile hydratase subunit beta
MRAVDGIHDLGGMDGFGPVEVEPNEPVFHAEWERRAAGTTFAFFMMGVVNGGQFRHSIERMDPAHYLGSSYYEHWATGVATRLLEVGKLTIDELEAKAGGRFPLSRPEQAATVEDPGPDVDAPRFGPGDAVRVRNVHPAGHTRCPRYIRGRRGTVIRNDKIASVPDVEAHTDGRRRKEPTYSVAFDAAELWGADGERGVTIHVDLWDSYLEPAL